MDPNAIAGMAFTLLLAGMVGGFILLHPIAKRLGALLEQKIKPPVLPDAKPSQDLARLQEQVASLERAVTQLSERQEFTEQLIAKRESPALGGRSEGA